MAGWGKHLPHYTYSHNYYTVDYYYPVAWHGGRLDPPRLPWLLTLNFPFFCRRVGQKVWTDSRAVWGESEGQLPAARDGAVPCRAHGVGQGLRLQARPPETSSRGTTIHTFLSLHYPSPMTNYRWKLKCIKGGEIKPTLFGYIIGNTVWRTIYFVIWW